ncbi:uncharacterized protein LOC135080280 [Ostrinia nubilalis]|uniref:uncharacterized protein LOC135080280 n=1 Tax=Ostrinia nubilalis TaxID=29057 RepID=UPI0030822813
MLVAMLLTALDVPLIAGVLEPFARDNETAVASAEECFELPPIKHLPGDISENVLESIINEFKDVSSDAEEIRRAKSEELQRKLKLYNSIMEKKCDEELIHSSRRSRRRDGGSGSSTPRMATPVRRADAVSYTSPCLMNVSVYGEVPQNDDLLEKQIEEKEKMLAKLLNLESLSISTPKTDHEKPEPPPQPTYKKFQMIDTPYIDPPKEKPAPKQIQDSRPIDLVPKVVQLPNNWNLGDIELKLEKTNGLKGPQAAMSPEEPIESDWEII